MVGCTTRCSTCAQRTPCHRSGGTAWSEERDRLAALLTARRSTFITACERLGVDVNPSHDGFFAWYECENPAAIAEACADQHVYLVPLTGGVRIGLCAVPESKVERVAQALARAVEAVK